MSDGVSDEPDGLLRAPRSSATSLLLTVLGEFVLPAGGSVWTSTLVRCAAELDISEKNARQAIARIASDGLIESTRCGRLVRWNLTPAGRDLLEVGAARIYAFGTRAGAWDGRWLVVHVPAADPDRTRRDRLRTQLAFVGAGELTPNLFVLPHVDREDQVREVLTAGEPTGSGVVFRSAPVELDEQRSIVERAWDLDRLAADYAEFVEQFGSRRPASGASAFGATVELVHEWRRFPFGDPELPAELLPDGWTGHAAAELFARCRERWAGSARSWFADVDRVD